MGELVKVGEVANRYGISTRTLRYYEEIGLLECRRVANYAYRMLDDANIKKLEQILILRKLNIGLKDIQSIFNNSESQMVLEVLGKKVENIDEEVALLYELKEVVLSFIRQIEQADFSKDSDVKMLYNKAKEIEMQLVSVDYEGNASPVNRLFEVTEKLEKRPDIVKKRAHFYNIFSVCNPIEAYELYKKAFGVEKVSEEYPDGMAYIGVEINGFYLLLREEHQLEQYAGQACCARFDSKEDLLRAYDLLNDKNQGEIHEDWHWTPLAAFVVDKFSVHWMLCI